MAGPVVKIKKLSAEAIAPRYAHAGDAGMDLFSNVDVEIPSRDAALIGTGISIQLPPGMEAQVRPRSGLALKHHLISLMHTWFFMVPTISQMMLR